MKTILSVLFVCLLFSISCAQFSSNITGYNLYVYKLSAPPPQVDYIMGTDSVGMILQWERGIANIDSLIVPAGWEEYYHGWIENEEGLWAGDVTASSHTIVLLEGYYAFALNEVDINNNMSGKSLPFYLQSKFIYAKIPLNILMLKRIPSQ